MPTSGAQTCTPCPTNSFTGPDVVGAVSDEDCKCKQDYYGHNVLACAQCLVGSTSPFGSETSDACVCAKGYTGMGSLSMCSKCPEGKFKDAPGSALCTSCSEDFYSPSASTASGDCYPAPKVVFLLAIGGGISAADVTDAVKLEILDGTAQTLGVPVNLLKMTSISDARRRLLAVNIEIEAAAPDSTAASNMAARSANVGNSAMNAARNNGLSVESVGVTASIVNPPTSPSTTPAPSDVALPGATAAPPASPEPSGGTGASMIVGIAVGVGVLLVTGFSYYVVQMRSGAPKTFDIPEVETRQAQRLKSSELVYPTVSQQEPLGSRPMELETVDRTGNTLNCTVCNVAILASWQSCPNCQTSNRAPQLSSRITPTSSRPTSAWDPSMEIGRQIVVSVNSPAAKYRV